MLDIEGTTTPISFVTDVLFPYARNNVGRHLSATYASAETQDDIKLLCSQVRFFFGTLNLLSCSAGIMIQIFLLCFLKAITFNILEERINLDRKSVV